MSSQPPSRRTIFLAGVKAELPILLGVIPFGMIYGVLALQAGLPHGAAQAMSAVVFAGSAQFMAVQLIRTGTPAVVLVLSIFIINLRHALYSASLAPYMARLPLRWRAVLAYLLTDEAFVVTITHYQQDDQQQCNAYGLCHLICPIVCNASALHQYLTLDYLFDRH